MSGGQVKLETKILAVPILGFLFVQRWEPYTKSSLTQIVITFLNSPHLTYVSHSYSTYTLTKKCHTREVLEQLGCS